MSAENIGYGWTAIATISAPILAAVGEATGGDYDLVVQGGSVAILLAGITFLARQFQAANALLIQKQQDMQDKLIGVITATTATQTQHNITLNSVSTAVNGLQIDVEALKKSIDNCHIQREQCTTRLDAIKAGLNK